MTLFSKPMSKDLLQVPLRKPAVPYKRVRVLCYRDGVESEFFQMQDDTGTMTVLFEVRTDAPDIADIRKAELDPEASIYVIHKG